MISGRYRNPSIKAYGTPTWNSGSVGMVSSRILAGNVRTELTKLLETFVNDYLSVSKHNDRHNGREKV